MQPKNVRLLGSDPLVNGIDPSISNYNCNDYILNVITAHIPTAGGCQATRKILGLRTVMMLL